MDSFGILDLDFLVLICCGMGLGHSCGFFFTVGRGRLTCTLICGALLFLVSIQHSISISFQRWCLQDQIPRLQFNFLLFSLSVIFIVL
jgi:hypothetical protein